MSLTGYGRLRVLVLASAAAAAAGCAGRQPAVSVAPEAFSARTGAPSAYALAPDDTLRIAIFRRTQITPLVDLNPVQVMPDGRISLPLVGEVDAGGLTVGALQDSVTTRLRAYLVDPVVSIVVLDAVGRTVSVLGEVASPGTYTLLPETTALEALALAGGTTQNADLERVVLLRRDPRGDAAADPATSVDIDELLRTADTRGNVLLQPRDILYVPPDSVSRRDQLFAHIATIAAPFTQVIGTITQVLILVVATR